MRMAYLSLKATLLTEDIFLSHCLTTARWLCQRKFPKIILIQILEELTVLFNELTSRKREKMVIHERVSLFILLVLRRAWPLGDITAVNSCMR